MLTKTTGIVIRTIKFGEASAICHILTEQFGLLGFHIPSAFKNKGKVRVSYLQPLNVLELSFNSKKTKSLQSIQDVTCLYHCEPVSFSQQAFYHVIVEILQQMIKDNEINHDLFVYLKEEALPSVNTELHYWQLPFVMINLLHHYGCAPNIDTFNPQAHLDLKNGIFMDGEPTVKYYSNKEISGIIYEIMTRGIRHLDNDHRMRQQLIQDLVLYYKLHIDEGFELKSMEVMMKMR
jgi:DNA repair protein RecO (recombination protein O)